MKDPLFKTLKDFISLHWKKGSPILLGFSGGVDSCALFSLLLECRRFFDLDLRVAHFDHAWREESLKEALILKKTVEDLGLFFYSERAEGSLCDGSNLEEKARNERYFFFQEVYRQVGAQALLLAHQREDLAETVLKRLFEGAGILSLAGMEPRSIYEGMVVWRPFLSVSRDQIVRWNLERGLSPFKDRTNFDLHFLRPRMREELFPLLEKCFGKGVRQSLLSIGEESSLCRNFMQGRFQLHLKKKKSGFLGSFFPVMDCHSEDSFERQELVRFFLRDQKLSLSRASLKLAVSLLEKNVSDKKIDVSKGHLHLDRGNLVWIQEEVPDFHGKVPLENFQTISKEGWQWELSWKERRDVRLEESLLSDFLKGEIFYQIPRGEGISFCSYKGLDEKERKRVSSYLSKNKIPAKMREIFPFVINKNGLIDNCFSFENCTKSNVDYLFLSIILKKNVELKDNIFPL